MNDDDLDQILRGGLRGRAREADSGGEYASAARRGVQRRRNIRAGLASAAVLAVIVPAAIVSAQHGDHSGVPAGRTTNQTGSGPVSPNTTAPASTTGGDVLADWRVESFGGVQLWVPPDWGWGASPTQIAGDSSGPYMCDETRDRAYVGRPLVLSDMCVGGSPLSATVPYVWFDSPLAVGTADLGDGFTQRTVDVGGMRVTAADRDVAELATILGSAEPADVDANGCASNLAGSPALSREADQLARLGDAESVSVCIYSDFTDGSRLTKADEGSTGLMYSTEILGQRAQAVVDALLATPVDSRPVCLVGAVGLDVPVLVIHGSHSTVVEQVSLSPCDTRYFDGHARRDLTKANVATWDIDGVGTYTFGGDSGFFRGILG